MLTAKKSSSAVWIILATLVLLGAGLVAAAEEADHGQEVFMAQKCNLCHSIDTLGIERRSKSEATAGPDLSTVGDKHTPEWIASYLKKEETMNDKEHKKGFRGEDADLQALVDWLGSLKSPDGGATSTDQG